jgi:hypothetical protein
MPDEYMEVAEQQEGSQAELTDEQLQAAFDEDDEPGGDAPSDAENEEEMEDGGDPGDDPGEEQKEEQPAEDDESKAESEPEELDDLSEILGEDQDKPEDGKPAQQQQQQEQQPHGQGEPPHLTKEQFLAYRDFGKDILPMGKVVVGDEEYDFDKTAEEFPDVKAWMEYAIPRGAEKVAANMLQQLTSGDNPMLMTRDMVEQRLSQVSAEIAEYRWREAIRDEHPDGLQVMNSQEFQSWLGKQKSVKGKLDENGVLTTTPEQAISIIGKFKAAKSQAAAKAHDQKAERQKANKDALHGGSARSRPNAGATDMDMNDIEAAFNEVDDFEKNPMF